MLLWFLGCLVAAVALSIWLGSALYLLVLLAGVIPTVIVLRFKRRSPTCPRCGTPMQVRALGALVPGLICPVCGHVEAHTKLKS